MLCVEANRAPGKGDVSRHVPRSLRQPRRSPLGPALPREPAEAGTDQGPGHVRAAVSGRAAAWRSPSLRCVSPPRSTGAARRTGGDAGRSSVRSARGS